MNGVSAGTGVSVTWQPERKLRQAEFEGESHRAFRSSGQSPQRSPRGSSVAPTFPGKDLQMPEERAAAVGARPGRGSDLVRGAEKASGEEEAGAAERRPVAKKVGGGPAPPESVCFLLPGVQIGETQERKGPGGQRGAGRAGDLGFGVGQLLPRGSRGASSTFCACSVATHGRPSPPTGNPPRKHSGLC